MISNQIYKYQFNLIRNNRFMNKNKKIYLKKNKLVNGLLKIKSPQKDFILFDIIQKYNFYLFIICNLLQTFYLQKDDLEIKF